MLGNHQDSDFRRRSARRRLQRGATLFEAAMMMMIFLTLIFAVCGFGHALYVYHALNTAAKEGTRWAAVNGETCADDNTCTTPASASDIQTHVQNSLPASIDQSKANVTAQFLAPTPPVGSPGPPAVCTVAVPSTTNPAKKVGPFSNYPGCTVEVTIVYPYTFIFPALFQSNNTIQMSTTSEMVIVH